MTYPSAHLLGVGMCDALTNYIVDRTRSSSPLVLKYVPYGALVEVRSLSCLSSESSLIRSDIGSTISE